MYSLGQPYVDQHGVYEITSIMLTQRLQARRQEFPEGGSSTRIASRASRGRGSGGLERPPEAQGYLEQNP